MQKQTEHLIEAFSEFQSSLNKKRGECEILKKQQEQSVMLLEKAKEDLSNYSKAVEVLSLVQKTTRDKVKNSFEGIVTHALNYIFDSDKHSFELVFTKRGNLPELKFAVKTPDKTEPFDPLDTDGGSVNNILSLALRIVLMEVATPKIYGFLLADEVFNYVDNEYLENGARFLKEISNKMKRQVIAISHEKDMLAVADNILEIK